jgi:hypothetical protein
MPDPAAHAEAVEARMRARVREFDIVALLELLAHLGYRREEVLLRSHLSSTTQVGLIHDIEFRKHPLRQVVITLNMGLLSPHSPLPSYFFQLLESANVDEDAMTAFVGFFDHAILSEFLASIYPESNAAVFRNWEGTKRSHLSLLSTRSLSTLHWLFQGVFPELGVVASHGTLTRKVRVEPIRLGFAVLGKGGALGGISTVPVPGLEVMLFCDEDYTDQDKPWADEIRRRLASVIFPILEEANVDLRVMLTIRSQRGWAQLGPGSYLGFDRIRGGAERNRVIVVHKGPVPRRRLDGKPVR